MGKTVLLPVVNDRHLQLIDCSILTQGVYVLRISFEEYDEVVRFVKE
jgi:hypothetical protein